MKLTKESAGLIIIPALTLGILSIPKFIAPFNNWDRSFTIQLSLLITALLYTLIIAGKKEVGLCFNFTKQNKKHLIMAVIIGFASLIFMILVSAFAKNLKHGSHPGMNSSFIIIVLKIYLLASFTEELYNRGCIMHFFKEWKDIKIGFATVPNLIAALLFALAHLGLIKFMDYRLVIVIVFSAFCLGLTAGAAREDSGSLFPAYLVHLTFNLIGSGLPMLLMQIAK